ncbi:hypothetical protein AUJ67_01890 [Candidatus Desantisbacteria bacterium CG1_02_49_89]|nr:MAG: hypothetical protein AUJ67_01890 [Candidatus Desantisbacteria bacterium CG1_02_49_89]
MDISNVVNLIIFIFLVALGYFAGTAAEKKHYRSIKEREKKFLGMPAVTIEKAEDESGIADARLVCGSVVVSVDYYKRFLAALRNIAGGEVMSYETLLDRGRREAVLRMKESAAGADMIVNMRLETATISGKANRKAVGTVEVMAYGTAITLKR